MDLSRKDDIESWFYMLVEGTNGRIPWQEQRGCLFLKKSVIKNE